MSQHLTICYLTSRKDPKIEWFLSSFSNQVDSELNFKLVVVDFYSSPSDGWSESDVAARWAEFDLLFEQYPKFKGRYCFTPCKPNIWQGKYRLTKEDWWAAANGRNTGLCMASDGWIAYIDDLSVLTPHWLQSIKIAMRENYVVFGSYRKVNNLAIENGEIKSFTPHSEDNRLNRVNQDVSICEGGWLYGCTLAGSVEHFLTVGGWPEYADGLKFEDCLMGVGLANAGIPVRYDRRMMVIESEEHHHGGKVFIAKDKGVSPNDKSHAALAIAKQSKYFPNYYEGGIRRMREEVLSGKPFPIVQIPQHDWYDSQPISEMS